MSSNNLIYNKSATDMLKYGAIVLIIAEITSFAINLFLTITRHIDDTLASYLGIIGKTILTIAMILLGTAIYKIGLSFPTSQNQYDSTRTWLYVYAASILLGYIPTIGFVPALIGIIAGIVGILKLNRLFKFISDSVPQQGTMNSWLFPVYAFYGLITVGLAIIIAFILAITGTPIESSAAIASVIIYGVGVLVAGGVGVVLFRNSKILEDIRQNFDFSTILQRLAPGEIYQPLEPAKPFQPAKFCSSCGDQLIATDKFCPTCGSEVT